MRRERFITPVSCMSPRSHSDLIYDSLYSFIRDIHPPASAAHPPFTSEDALILIERERERGWVMLVQMRLKLVCCFWTVQHSQLSAASIMQRHEEEERCHTEQKTDSERMKWASVNRQRQTADERGELDHWQMCEVVSPPKYSDFQI